MGYQTQKDEAMTDPAVPRTPKPAGVVNALSKVIDYIGRDAVTANDADRLELAQELARYALQSFKLQTTENPELVLLRNVCYAILRTKGYDVRELLQRMKERR